MLALVRIMQLKHVLPKNQSQSGRHFIFPYHVEIDVLLPFHSSHYWKRKMWARADSNFYKSRMHRPQIRFALGATGQKSSMNERTSDNSSCKVLG